MTDCVFLQNKYVKEQKINAGKAYKILEKTWGEKRFEADCNKKEEEMKVSDLADKFKLKVFSGAKGLDNEIRRLRVRLAE